MKVKSLVTTAILSGVCTVLLAGCNKTNSEEDYLRAAFKPLAEKAEMQFEITTTDELGTSNPYEKEVSLTYQYEPRQNMLKGLIDGEDHMVYSTGGVYYTYTPDGYVKDTYTDDELYAYISKIKGYMVYDNFSNVVKEGTSEVDGVVCYRYYVKDLNDYMFGMNNYDDMEKTVYIRTDTNSVYYIELRYMVNQDGKRYGDFNDGYIRVKYFDETNIVVPGQISNAIEKENYDGSGTGLVDMSDLSDETVNSLRSGYYLEDGTYLASEPMLTCDWELRDENGNILKKYTYSSDSLIDMTTGEVTNEYSKVSETQAMYDAIGMTTNAQYRNYLDLGVDVPNTTLVKLKDMMKDSTQELVLDYYTAEDLFKTGYDFENPKWRDFEEYYNNKTVSEILDDAKRYNELTDDEKAIMFYTIDFNNGYVEEIDGGLRTMEKLALEYAGINAAEKDNIEKAYLERMKGNAE